MNKMCKKVKKHWDNNLEAIEKIYAEAKKNPKKKVYFSEVINSIDMSIDRCEFCKTYSSLLFCDGCPISKKTGEPHCRKTPYTTLFVYKKNIAKMLDWDTKKMIKIKRLIKLVKKEIVFLKTVYK